MVATPRDKSTEPNLQKALVQKILNKGLLGFFVFVKSESSLTDLQRTVTLGPVTVRRSPVCLVRYPDLVASFTVKKSPAMQAVGGYPNNCPVLVDVGYNSKVCLPGLKFYMDAVTDFHLGPVLTESFWRAHSRLTLLLKH